MSILACPQCNGEGYVKSPRKDTDEYGNWYYGRDECPTCEGSGSIYARPYHSKEPKNG